MKCELCHQQEAETVLFRPTPSGKAEELYVCQDCAARERVFGADRNIQVAAMDAPPPPPGFEIREVPKEVAGQLGEMFGKLSEQLEALGIGDGQLTCPKCGASFDSVRAYGLMGCPQCYTAFRKVLGALLEETQQASAYRGEPLPGRAMAARIAELERQLKEALEQEDYARAKVLQAALRRAREADGEVDHGLA